ncbi:hypothetical protein D3C83_117480 [compost metagenome]
MRISSFAEMICPPPGKSGPGRIARISLTVAFGCRMTCAAASATSFRLCDGMRVEKPTGMPKEPFSRPKGSRAGSSCGSSNLPS